MCIEECFETGKEMGMEDYEVRGLDRLVSARDARDDRMAGSCRHLRSGRNIYRRASLNGGNTCPTVLPPDHSRGPSFARASALASTPQSDPAALGWSWWRRCHQSRASYFHTKRRCAAG